MKTNILVQYDGGGYNGCIWEWNFFFIDADGTFHDIYSSGCGGIDTKLAAMLLIDNNGNDFSNKVCIYHLDNEEELKEFANETNCSLVKSVVQWFNGYNSPDAEPFAICSECGGKISDASEILPTDDYWGEIVCPDCHTTCDNCYNYSQDIQEHNDQYLCEYCREDIKSQEIQDEQTDLLFQSLTTGKPDMFSDEMRWYWD